MNEPKNPSQAPSQLEESTEALWELPETDDEGEKNEEDEGAEEDEEEERDEG